jgi:hypothetical protein
MTMVTFGVGGDGSKPCIARWHPKLVIEIKLWQKNEKNSKF